MNLVKSGIWSCQILRSLARSPLLEGKEGGEDSEQMKGRVDFELESHVQFPTASESI